MGDLQDHRRTAFKYPLQQNWSRYSTETGKWSCDYARNHNRDCAFDNVGLKYNFGFGLQEIGTHSTWMPRTTYLLRGSLCWHRLGKTTVDLHTKKNERFHWHFANHSNAGFTWRSYWTWPISLQTTKLLMQLFAVKIICFQWVVSQRAVKTELKSALQRIIPNQEALQTRQKASQWPFAVFTMVGWRSTGERKWMRVGALRKFLFRFVKGNLLQRFFEISAHWHNVKMEKQPTKLLSSCITDATSIRNTRKFRRLPHC